MADGHRVRIWTLLLSVQDAHTNDKGELSVDRQQDYVLDLVRVTSAGSLLVEFHRLYDTCDDDDYLIDVCIGRGVYRLHSTGAVSS